METRYHIGLLTGTLLILAILSYAYYADYNYRKELARTEQTEQQETEQTVSTQGGAHKEGVYYLKNATVCESFIWTTRQSFMNIRISVSKSFRKSCRKRSGRESG